MMTVRIRNAFISLFVVAWLVLFYYESMRTSYLSPLWNRELPKFKFLFPPAGWIMFFRIDESEGRAEVYGIKAQAPERIDPHRIFKNRWIGYDNIRRNVLITVLDPYYAEPFCGYLKRKFPEFDRFAVLHVYFPSVIKDRNQKLSRLAYAC